MVLFNEDGHLTDLALEMLENPELTELERLEISEHLSFCDECLLRYTLKLDECTLLEPEEPMAQNIFKRIRRKAVRIMFSKYATVAVAASMIVFLWGGGVLPLNKTHKKTHTPNPTTSSYQQNEGIAQKINKATNGITESMNRFFLNMSADHNKDDAQAPKSSPEFKAKTPKEAEKVFDQNKENEPQTQK